MHYFHLGLQEVRDQKNSVILVNISCAVSENKLKMFKSKEWTITDWQSGDPIMDITKVDHGLPQRSAQQVSSQ